MPHYEKISIYIPHSTKSKLEDDARQFEIMKANGSEINHNELLGRIVLGYYDQFYLENLENLQRVENVLRKHIRKATVDNIKDVSYEILSSLSLIQQTSSNKKGDRLSLKPTSKTASLIQDIKMANIHDNISNTFARLFTSYLEKPTYVRERIIHKESYESIQEAIQRKQSISFSTRRNMNLVHTVFPYCITIGQEEIYNYLLCAETESGSLKAKAYRLCRITNCRKSRNKTEFNDDVKDYLDQMAKHGPAYEINDNERAVVYFTDKGFKSYELISFHRPSYDDIRQTEGGYECTFSCSKKHLEQYLRRFDSGEAKVIEPEWLRKNIECFYQEQLDFYSR
ncbi:MAG: WYL domain-containing protein [Clostridiales bacterium]|nr:WYL domain-containing protein [Clostridiales bacterium]